MLEEAHLTAVLDALGYRDDPEGSATPGRFLDVLRDFAPGQPAPALECFDAPGPDLVVMRALPFHSLCAHHLLPFFGEADIAYRPTVKVAGLGGLARALRHFARQPQLQERLGAGLADHLHAALGGPVGVRLRARQLCMEMRGIESLGTVETRAWRGPADEELRRALA